MIDEAHRSVYQKYGAIFEWFDANLVGLTATPKDEVDHNTYRLFHLEDGVPTDAYGLDVAVGDGFLVPPFGVSVGTKFLGQGITYADLTEQEKDEWDALDWGEDGPPDAIDSEELNRFLFNEDTVDKVLASLMTDGYKVAGGDRLGKTIIFAKNQAHAEFIEQRFNVQYPEYGGDLARVITHQATYAQSLIDAFSQSEKAPHIAISVDMLDTGIDVPEIVNLVFFKMVRSKSKFWQMIGRGTRLRPDLFGPGEDKRDFFVFDFCGNLDYFSQNLPGSDGSLQKSLTQRLFEWRLGLILALDDANAAPALRESTATWLHEFVAGMNLDNFFVRAHRQQVETWADRERWASVSKDDAGAVLEHLAGLPSALRDPDEDAKRFDLLVLRRQLAQLEGDAVAAERVRETVQAIAAALLSKRNIPSVAEQLALLDEVAGEEWWVDVTLPMLEVMRLRLRGLVRFVEKTTQNPIYTDFEDTLDDPNPVDLPQVTSGMNWERFRTKAQTYLKRHEDHIALQKLRRNKQLTPADLDSLAEMLIASGGDQQVDIAWVTERAGALGPFIRSLVGLDRAAATEAFAAYLDQTKFSVEQVRFVSLIVDELTVVCDPEFRGVLAAHGYTLDPETGEVAQLAPYAGSFSVRATQITRNIDRYEAQWRSEHPDEEPGPTLRRAWDRRAWAQARPDKVVPESGAELQQRWVDELHQLGFTPPTVGLEHRAVPIGRVNRDAVVDLVLSRLGAARRSSWNAADIRGEVERIVAAVDIVASAPVRHELAEDLSDRTVACCVPLLARDDVPEHVRSLTSREVLNVEADLLMRLAARAEQPTTNCRVGTVVARRRLDHTQRQVVAALGGNAQLLVIEGAAGAGKTTTLAAARELLEMQDTRLMVVTPTLKAAKVAQEQIGAAAFTSAWLVHQHGFRWDADGHWSRNPVPRDALPAQARLLPGDLLLVDEAGMLDQDVARALLTIADETNARIAFVGDRHQLPAVGRGGVLDHAARWARPEACLQLETVHRFTDPEYAGLTLLMRTGRSPDEVFDMLHARGLIQIHRSEIERLAALSDFDGTVIADTREQVASLNAAIRDQRIATGVPSAAGAVITAAGERLGAGDQIATRRNDRDLGVANRDRWTVTGTDGHGGLVVRGRGGARTLPADYVRQHVELAYATTVHGAQGETVDQAHLVIGEATGAAAAYVGMTRGRNRNTAHLVAETLDQARAQWLDVFSRDRADLGPGDAAQTAAEDIERYGPRALPRATERASHSPRRSPRRTPEPFQSPPAPDRSPGISLEYSRR